MRVDGDILTMTPLGESFTAKMDGTEAPVKGDRGADRVSIKQVNPNTLEQTYKLDGKLGLDYKNDRVTRRHDNAELRRIQGHAHQNRKHLHQTVADTSLSLKDFAFYP